MTGTRPYKSAKRADQAQATRRRILAAARRLFAENGYAGTTITDIAHTADLSEATIYKSFGGKADLVRAQLEEVDRLSGIDALIAVTRNPDAAPAEQTMALARFQGALFEQHGALILASRLSPDPELRAFIEEGLARHRGGVGRLAAQWAARGLLRSDMGAERAAAVIGTLCSFETYGTLRTVHGWTAEECVNWIAEAPLALVLAGQP